jgi:hypothetical protein
MDNTQVEAVKVKLAPELRGCSEKIGIAFWSELWRAFIKRGYLRLEKFSLDWKRAALSCRRTPNALRLRTGGSPATSTDLRMAARRVGWACRMPARCALGGVDHRSSFEQRRARDHGASGAVRGRPATDRWLGEK